MVAILPESDVDTPVFNVHAQDTLYWQQIC
jgi:hypothetical protein